MILELQKDRFFEDLTAKYWNSSVKGSCIRNDDSEGITLESLGGVFIATLVGLGKLFRGQRNGRKINYMLNCPWHSTVLAMLVLVGEVYYYKRLAKKEVEMNKSSVFTKKVQPFVNFEYSEKVVKNSFLLGSTGQFTPVDKKPRLSFVSVYPRD